MRKKLSTAVFVFFVLSLAGGAVIYVNHVKSSALAVVLLSEQEDPLFDFLGLREEEWPEAINIIKTANKEMIGHLGARFDSYKIYPYDFWGKARLVAEKRTIFLNHPTWFNAFQLLNVESRALAAYTADLESFSRLWQAAWQNNSSGVSREAVFPFFPGVATDAATMEATMAMIRENSVLLQKDLGIRRKCLFFGFCTALSSASNTTSAEGSGGERYSDIPKLKILPSDHVSDSLKYLNAVWASPVRSKTPEASSDALTHLTSNGASERLFSVKTGCFGESVEPTLFYLWETRNKDAREVLLPKLATNSFFRAIHTERLLPQDVRPREAGFSYSWQPETNWYMCPDLRYYPELATLQALAEQATSTEPRIHGLGEELRRAEVIGPETALVYIENLMRLKKDAGVSLREEDEIYRRVRIWETKSGNLINVVRGLERDVELFSGIANAMDSRTQPITMLVSRSHLSFLFASWNPSVWRLEQAPKFISADYDVRPYIKNYWQLRQELNREAIRKIQELSRMPR